jgi:hypothetical protein
MRKKRRLWTDEEIAILHAAYAGNPDLSALSAALDRDRTGICRKARQLGLTTRRRRRGAPAEVIDDPGIEHTIKAMEPAPVMNPCGEPVQVGSFSVGNQTYPEYKPCMLGMGHGGVCEA